mgnify:FL=1
MRRRGYLELFNIKEMEFMYSKVSSVYDLDFSMLSKVMPNAKILDNFLLVDNYSEQAGLAKPMKTPYPLCLHLYFCIICLDGEAEIKVNFKTYKLTRNKAALKKKNNVLEIVSVSDDFKCISIVTGEPTDDSRFKGDTITVLSVRNHLAVNPILELDDKVMSRIMTITKLIRETMDDCEMRDELKKAMITSMFYAMSCFFIPRMDNMKKERLANVKLTRKEMIFRNFIHNVENHYTKERQITFYADLEYITPKYLSTVVYEVSNRHAGDWINEYVIFEAKKLLGSEFLSIQEICYKLNFSNQSFFGKYFKRHTGMSPLEYRKSVAK